MVLVLLACVTHPPPAAPPPPPRGHGTQAVLARDAILFGDVAGFDDAMRELAAGRTSPALDDAARSASLAATVAEGVAGLGPVLDECGACHVATGATLPAPPEWPVQDEGVRPEMERHGQALDQLWSGLVRRQPGDLVLGTKTLSTSLLFLSRPDAPPAAIAMDETVTTDSDALVAASTDAARRDAFVKLLGDCAACHLARPGDLQLEPE